MIAVGSLLGPSLLVSGIVGLRLVPFVIVISLPAFSADPSPRASW